MAKEFTRLDQIITDKSWLWLRINKWLYSGWLAPENVPSDLMHRFGDFHEYTNFDGETEYRKTLGLHKTTSEYITNSMFAEEPEISIKGSNEKRILEILEDNDFYQKEIEMTETWIALGGRVKVLLRVNGETEIDYIEADGFQPTQWNNKEVTGGVFFTERSASIKGVIWYYTMLQWHEQGEIPLTLDDDGEILTQGEEQGYYIRTQVFKGRTLGKLEVSCFNEVFNVFGIKVEEQVQHKKEIEMAMFQYSKVPRKNNKVFRSPMGLGWFTNSLDTEKSCDESFDSLSVEIELARRKLGVGETAQQSGVGKDGITEKKQFNSKKRAYLVNMDTHEPFISEIAGLMRTTDIITALNTQLDIWDYKNNLSPGTTRFDGKGIKTATEVKTESSETARTIKVLENALARDWKKFIIKLVHFHNVMSDEDLGDIKEDDIEITFHDNIVIDENLEKEIFRAEITEGIRFEWEYRVQFLGETEVEAKAIIEENTEQVVEDDAIIPMPDESQEEFVQRFMSDATMMEEFPDESQRRQVAEESFEKGGS